MFRQGWGTGTSWTALRRLTTCGLICIYRITSNESDTQVYDRLDGYPRREDPMDEINRLETEQCGSTSVQLVQLPTRSNIPGVSMIGNTGDSEDH